MKTKLARTLVIAIITAAVFVAGAQAHRMWLLPSTFTLSGNEQWVTIDGAISNDLFFPNHVPLDLGAIDVVAPDGRTIPIERASTGKFRSTFDLRLDQQGTYKVTETGGTYFARWSENGETQSRRGELEAFLADGLDKRQDITFMHSARRVETFVTLGAPTTSVFAASGEGLEMVPVTHPNDLYAGEVAAFTFLLGGESATGLNVSLVRGQDRYRDESGEVVAIADEAGVVRFELTEPGAYLVEASAEGTTTIEGRKMVQYLGYSATFEVLPD